MDKANSLETWMNAMAAMPFLVGLITLFTLIMMIGLIANTNAIEKRIHWIQEHLEEEAKKRANSTMADNQGGNDRT